jgi:hypothetical protein
MPDRDNVYDENGRLVRDVRQEIEYRNTAMAGMSAGVLSIASRQDPITTIMNVVTTASVYRLAEKVCQFLPSSSFSRPTAQEVITLLEEDPQI